MPIGSQQLAWLKILHRVSWLAVSRANTLGLDCDEKRKPTFQAVPCVRAPVYMAQEVGTQLGGGKILFAPLRRSVSICQELKQGSILLKGCVLLSTFEFYPT